MFNIFRKQNTSNVTVDSLQVVETLANQALAVEPVRTIKKYPKAVLEIHNEFETAADRLLIEAKEILNEAAKQDISKVDRLKSLGFNQTEQVVKSKPIMEKAQLTKEKLQLLELYSVRYPNNKFITEEQVQQICLKYGLICGSVSKFKGFVPESNLKQIENFKLNAEDVGLHTSNGFFLKNGEIKKRNSYWHVYRIDDTDTYKLHAFQSENGIDFYARDDHNLFGLAHEGFFNKFTINKSNLQICAPLKDMDAKGMTIEKGYKMQPIHIPDPIVLQPVKGGYLILTAWGDEASDELVVNANHN